MEQAHTRWPQVGQSITDCLETKPNDLQTKKAFARSLILHVQRVSLSESAVLHASHGTSQPYGSVAAFFRQSDLHNMHNCYHVEPGPAADSTPPTCTVWLAAIGTIIHNIHPVIARQIAVAMDGYVRTIGSVTCQQASPLEEVWCRIYLCISRDAFCLHARWDGHGCRRAKVLHGHWSKLLSLSMVHQLVHSFSYVSFGH